MKKESQEKKLTYKEKLKSLVHRKNILITVLVVFLLIQYIQIQGVLGNFSFLQGRSSSLIDELGQLKDTYTQVGSDLNEVREFLRMPTKKYAGFDEPENDANDGKNENELQLAFFQYVDFLAKNKNIEQNLATYRTLLDGLKKSESFSSFLKAESLTVSDLIEDDNSLSLRISGPEGEELAVYYYVKDDSTLFFRTSKQKEEVDSQKLEELESEITEFLKNNKGDLLKAFADIRKKKAEIEAAINSEKTLQVKNELHIKLDPNSIEQNLKITYFIYNKTSDVIGEIVLDTKSGKILLADKNNEKLSLEVTDINTALIPFLKKLDIRTFIQKKVDQARKDIEATIEDKGFKLLLEQSKLKISAIPREDNLRYYYDIFQEDGSKLSVIVVEKSTGVVNIIRPDGTNAQNIFFFDPGLKKKTLEIPDNVPVYEGTPVSDKGSFNVLIAGKHGSLVDTMIFAHIDENKRTVRMISIPRDLFYNGRKINAFAHSYGMDELKRVLSDISGYKLDKYILIDMYAFIDVIDLIGGIDIHLNQAVIDPTYRTVDNGKEGTLHYEPGDYHLGGKESLRLARTRHTSSDFARAERQQMIIEAIQSKAQNFGFGDAETIYQIAKTVLGKTETDISLDEALAYYFRYQNYQIESNNVMSSGNVLYVPPYITTENCRKMINEAAAAGAPKPDCENQNNAYTLLPRDNNWNIIKWYFKENFEAA